MTVIPLAEAVETIRRGGLVAYPTETVWGLGADATSAAAVERLRRWKGRDADRPLSVLVDDGVALDALGVRICASTRCLIDEFWPGPLTLVLPRAESAGTPSRRAFAAGVCRRDDGALGVRCSSHPAARDLARRLADAGVGPITATSLNRSGEPPAERLPDAVALCGDGAEAPRILAAEKGGSGSGAATSVVDATGASPVLIRAGAVPRDAIEACFRETVDG